MRFALLFSASGLAAYFLGPYMPYWALMLLIAVMAALMGGNGWVAFLSAAMAVGIIWFIIPFMISLNTGSDLPEKIAAIMGVEHNMLLFAAASFMGFLIAGFSALTGNRFRKLFDKE